MDEQDWQDKRDRELKSQNLILFILSIHVNYYLLEPDRF
jgi:hypothetical protein